MAAAGEHPDAERRHGRGSGQQDPAPGVARGHQHRAEDEQPQRDQQPDGQDGDPDGLDVLPGPDEGALDGRAGAQGGAAGGRLAADDDDEGAVVSVCAYMGFLL